MKTAQLRGVTLPLCKAERHQNKSAGVKEEHSNIIVNDGETDQIKI